LAMLPQGGRARPLNPPLLSARSSQPTLFTRNGKRVLFHFLGGLCGPLVDFCGHPPPSPPTQACRSRQSARTGRPGQQIATLAENQPHHPTPRPERRVSSDLAGPNLSRVLMPMGRAPTEKPPAPHFGTSVALKRIDQRLLRRSPGSCRVLPGNHPGLSPQKRRNES
jgi:hypothetical protein